MPNAGSSRLRARAPSALSALLFLCVLYVGNASGAPNAACDTTLRAGMDACRSGVPVPGSACCAGVAAYSAAFCFCPGVQTFFQALPAGNADYANYLTASSTLMPMCGLAAVSCSSAPAPAGGAPPAQLQSASWTYAVRASSSLLKVAWAFPSALNLTSFDVRRSADPSFPTANSLSLNVNTSVTTNAGDAAGVFGIFDPLVAASSDPTLYYYSIRAYDNTGALSPWSPAAFTFDASAAGTQFTSPAGVAAPCGASILAPCASVQAALTAAPAGATVVMLHGTYSGSGNVELTMGGKALRVIGVAGTAGTVQNCSNAARGWLFNSGETVAGSSLSGLTILNGKGYSGGGIMFYNASAAVSNLVIRNCAADGSGALFAGVTAAGGGAVALYNSNSTFDSVNFSGNTATEPGGGGGVFAEINSFAVITNSVLANNKGLSTKGGNAKFATGSNAVMINCTVTGGNALLAGGIWSEWSSPVLVNVTVRNNRALYGGGVGVSMLSGLSMTNCLLDGNTADNYGGGFGGGLGVTLPLIFRNTVFSNNVALLQGGGVLLGAGGDGGLTVELHNCTVVNNTAPEGAGWFVQQGLLTVGDNTVVANNVGSKDGGGGYCGSSTTAVAASVFVLGGSTHAGNRAVGRGGAVFVGNGCNFTASGRFLGNSAGSGAGLLTLTGSNTTLAGAVIRGNNASTFGGGIYAPSPDSAVPAGTAAASVTLVGCSVEGNVASSDGAGVALESGRATLSLGTLAGNAAGGSGGGMSLKGGAQAVLQAVSVSGNVAAANGGGVAFAGTAATALLALYGSALGGNRAGGGGGGAWLAWPTYILDTGLLTNNNATTGGALSVAADFSRSTQACAMAVSMGLQCTAPLQGLSMSGNAAVTGASIFWSRAASPSAALACPACLPAWPMRANEVATEALSVAFAVAPAAATVTDAVMAPWSVSLLDFYSSVASTATGFSCTVTSGVALGASAGANRTLSSSLILSSAGSVQPAAGGVAAFSSLSVQGVVGRSYPLLVRCASSTAALPTLAANLTMAPCPPGTEAAADLRSCISCKLGSEFNLDAGGACKACPVGGDCPATDTLQALPDWWRSSNTSEVLFNCPLAGSCQPGQPAGDAACEEGYAGPVCGVCSPGYYPWGRSCKLCNDNFRWVMPFAGFCAALAFAALFMLPVKPDNTDPCVRAKIALTFLQVLGLIKDYAIRWRPKFLMTSLAYFDVLNIGLEITAPACGAAPVDFYQSYVVTMMLPAGALFVCWIMWRIYALLMRKWLRSARVHPVSVFGRELLSPRKALTDEEMLERLDAFKVRCLKNSCWLLMLLYPGVCKKVMQLYGTRSLDTGAFLRADYAVQTRDLAFQRLSKYSNYATGGAFMCILYPAGIPLLFMLSMRHERRAAEAKGNNFLDSYIGFVAAGYRVKALYWEVLEMLRKLCMAAIGVFAVDGAFNASASPDISGALSPVVQPFLGQSVTVTYMAILLWYRPYERDLHNLVQAGCLLITWACLLVGESLFNTATTTGAIVAEDQNSIGVWLATTLLIAVIGVILWALQGYAEDMYMTLRKNFPGLFVRSSTAKVAPLDAEAGEDARHAEALKGVTSHDLARPPRVADGDACKPTVPKLFFPAGADGR